MVNNKEYTVLSTVLEVVDERFPVYYKTNQKNKLYSTPWFFSLFIFDTGKIILSDLEAEIMKIDMFFSLSFLMLMRS